MSRALLMNPMERDIELFREFDLSQMTKPIFFFYTWNAPTVTIGKIQRNREQLIKEAESLGVPCYLRPTGGRAVLHGGDICYTFIAAQSDPDYGGTLSESFRKVNQMVIGLFQSVIASELLSLTPNTKYPTANTDYNCFSTHVSNEGLYQGHKIIGAAQAMGSRSFIQQGSIQLNKVDIELESLQSHKTLSELTGREYDLAEISLSLNKQSHMQDLILPVQSVHAVTI